MCRSSCYDLGLVCYLIREGFCLEWPLPVITELLGWSIVLVLRLAGIFAFYLKVDQSILYVV